MPVNIIAMEVAMTSPLTIVGTSSVWTETLLSQAKNERNCTTSQYDCVEFSQHFAFFCFGINSVCFKSIIYFGSVNLSGVTFPTLLFTFLSQADLPEIGLDFKAFITMRMKSVRSLREMTRLFDSDPRLRETALIKIVSPAFNFPFFFSSVSPTRLCGV